MRNYFVLKQEVWTDISKILVTSQALNMIFYFYCIQKQVIFRDGEMCM